MEEKDFRVVRKLKLLASQQTQVREVVVFGSRARGDATEESDLDGLIVVERLDHSIEKYISECAWEAGFHEDVLIVPVAVTVDAVKNGPLRESVFLKNVYREGVAI